MPDFNTVKPDDSQLVDQIDVTDFEKQNKFALHFTGYLNIPKDGLYILYDATAGESYLYLHGEKILTNENSSEQSIVLGLKKGLHPITVDYKIWKGNPNLVLQMEGPDMPKQIIDKTIFKH